MEHGGPTCWSTPVRAAAGDRLATCCPARSTATTLRRPAAPDVSRSFDAVDVIRAKRDGASAHDDQIDWVIDAYARGEVADEQMSALRWRSCCAG